MDNKQKLEKSRRKEQEKSKRKAEQSAEKKQYKGYYIKLEIKGERKMTIKGI